MGQDPCCTCLFLGGEGDSSGSANAAMDQIGEAHDWRRIPWIEIDRQRI